MENTYAFSIQISGDEATELKRKVAKELGSTGIAFPRDDPWQFEGPPAGAFGFSEGMLVFLQEAWKELIKVPKAVLALAEGVRDYLKNRPNASLTVTKADGTIVILNANMDGNAIVEALKQI